MILPQPIPHSGRCPGDWRGATQSPEIPHPKDPWDCHRTAAPEINTPLAPPLALFSANVTGPEKSDWGSLQRGRELLKALDRFLGHGTPPGSTATRVRS